MINKQLKKKTSWNKHVTVKIIHFLSNPNLEVEMAHSIPLHHPSLWRLGWIPLAQRLKRVANTAAYSRGEGFRRGALHHPQPNPQLFATPWNRAFYGKWSAVILSHSYSFLRKAAYFPGLLNCSFGEGENMLGSCQNTCNSGYWSFIQFP